MLKQEKIAIHNSIHQNLHHHNPNLELILKGFPQENEFLKSANIFHYLSDSTRLKILWLLAHSEECVNNISISVNMSVSAVSHHLRGLRQAGLIKNHRVGKEVYYKLANDKTGNLVHQLIDISFGMDCILNRLK